MTPMRRVDVARPPRRRPQSQPTVTLDLLSQLASSRTSSRARPPTSHTPVRPPIFSPSKPAQAPSPSPSTPKSPPDSSSHVPSQRQPMQPVPQRSKSAQSIHRMSATSSRAIRAAHTILDPAAIVKELVENALDAKATRIDVRLRGKACLSSISVSDNGTGISKSAYDTVCLPATTSKLSAMSDLGVLSTFGFRGEALSAIRAVAAKLTILTRTAQDATATLLTVASDGSLASTKPAARPVGTTVSIADVFNSLPVRKKEALANSARELTRCVTVIQSLAIISTHARIELRFASDLKVCSAPAADALTSNASTATSAPSLTSVRDTARSILGSRVTGSLLPVTEDELAVVAIPPPLRPTVAQTRATYGCHALISTASLSADGTGGRARSTHHYIYVNARPIALPRLTRAATDVYRRATGLTAASPTLIVNLLLPPWACDVNLAPDKRHVLVHDEDALIAGFVRMLESVWVPTTSSVIPVQSTQLTITEAFSKCAASASQLTTSHDDSLEHCDKGNRQGSANLLEVGGRDGLDVGEDIADKNVCDRESKAMDHGTDSANEPQDLAENISLTDSHSCVHKLGTTMGDIPSTPTRNTQSPPSPMESMPSQQDDQGNTPTHPTASNMPSDKSSPHSDAAPPVSVLDFADQFRHGGSKTMARKRRRGSGNDRGMDDLLSTPLEKMNHRDVLKVVEERRNRIRNFVVRPSSRAVDLTARMARVPTLKSDASGKHQQSPIPHTTANVDTTPSPADVSVSGGEKDELMVERAPEMRQVRKMRNGAIQSLQQGSDAESEEEGSTKKEKQAPMSIVLDGEQDDSSRHGITSRSPTLRVNWDIICEQSGTSQADDGMSDIIAGFEKASLASKGTDGESYKASSQAENIQQEDAASRELSRLFRQEWFGQLRVMGQFNRGFILGQLGRDVFIIDQHASDEKVNFERLQASTVIGRQRLVKPLQLEFSTEDELLICQHLDALRAGGFDLRYDGDAVPTRRLALIAQPVSKHTMFVEEDLRDIVDALRGGVFAAGTKVLRPPRVRAMLASRACRSSIMIGSALHVGEMRQVLQNLCEIEHPWTCPHGRPTMRHLCTLP